MRRILTIIVGLALVASAGGLLQRINQQRDEHRLTRNEPMENAPPQLVVTSTALGGMRGLLINYLWLRAVKLREQGKHYEIVQLYDWINKLEPGIPQIWNYTAREMAYNISVAMPTPEERWRWVWKGIEHLRDYGVRYNPEEPELYWNIGWIFIEKMGMSSLDEHRFFYQQQLLAKIEPILGIEQDIAALAQDPERRQRLYDAFKMEPEKMLAIEAKYAKIDWRLPAAHALYWAEQGVQLYEALPEDEKNEIAVEIMDRLLNISLNQLFEYGYVLGKGERGLICVPNLDLVPVVHSTFERIEAKWGVQEGIDSHEHFLQKVVWQSYMYGDREMARKYYAILQKKFAKPNYEQALDKYTISEVGRRVKGIAQRHLVESYIISTLLAAYDAIFASSYGGSMGRKLNQLGHGLTKFSRILYEEYVKRHGDLSTTNRLEKPRSFLYFHKAAMTLFKEKFLKRYGAERGEEIWQRFSERFPFFQLIDKKEEEKKDEKPK